MDAGGILSEPGALAVQDGPLPPLPRLRFGSVPLAATALLQPLPGRDATVLARRPHLDRRHGL